MSQKDISHVSASVLSSGREAIAGQDTRFTPYLTAAKRTLMLDSDRPLTILSIMFSVSVI